MSDKRVNRIKEKAKEIVSNNEKIKALISTVRKKLDKLSTDAEERSSFIYQVLVLVRMLRAHIKGEYSAFSTATILTIVFGLVYFITPLDLIPDFIPGLGLTDDISIIYMVFKSIADDISKFRYWEMEAQNS